MGVKRVLAVLLAALLLLASPAHAMRVWVYTLVAADYDGDLLLPHFINHYHHLGLTWKRFLVQIHHSPDKHSEDGVHRALGTCMGYSLECRVWRGTYSPEAHMQRMMQMLDDYVKDPIDWIIMADLDEFQQWQGNVKSVLSIAADVGASYLTGPVIDRVSHSGDITRIPPVAGSAAQSLFERYPQQCKLVGKAYSAPHWKVVAFKAYYRPNRSRTRIIRPDDAAEYFGPCFPNEPCIRPRSTNLDLDLYNITPYYRHVERYKYDTTPEDAKDSNFGFWTLKRLEIEIPIHHFRWHTGVLESTKDRLVQYGGDCILGKNVEEGSCNPLLSTWHTAAQTYLELRNTRRLNLEEIQCQILPEGADMDVDTTYNGLAWEEFEPSMHVTAKVRNTARGDSQSRNAHLKVKLGNSG